MSQRNTGRTAGLFGLVLTLAGQAGALPLLYTVVQSESNLMVQTNSNGSIDLNPDPTEGLGGGDEFPVPVHLSAFSNTVPSGQSRATADVGLPGDFNNGANGITFSELKIHAFNAPGVMSGSLLVPTPLDPLGGNVLLVSFAASVTSLQIELNTPFSSMLTPSANPDEWLWSGVADVTISGVLAPELSAQLTLPATVPPTPFSQVVSLPLAGTFAGVPGGTRIHVGIASNALHDQDLSLPPIHQELDLLDLGLITLEFDLSSLTLADISSSIVYRNATPIPEPGTALLVGLGIVGLALRRRR